MVVANTSVTGAVRYFMVVPRCPEDVILKVVGEVINPVVPRHLKVGHMKPCVSGRELVAGIDGPLTLNLGSIDEHVPCRRKHVHD